MICIRNYEIMSIDSTMVLHLQLLCCVLLEECYSHQGLVHLLGYVAYKNKQCESTNNAHAPEEMNNDTRNTIQ